jgi:hypothetical protein
MLKRLIAISSEFIGVFPCTPVVGPPGKDLEFIPDRIEKSFDIFFPLFILQSYAVNIKMWAGHGFLQHLAPAAARSGNTASTYPALAEKRDIPTWGVKCA